MRTHARGAPRLAGEATALLVRAVEKKEYSTLDERKARFSALQYQGISRAVFPWRLLGSAFRIFYEKRRSSNDVSRRHGVQPQKENV